MQCFPAPHRSIHARHWVVRTIVLAVALAVFGATSLIDTQVALARGHRRGRGFSSMKQMQRQMQASQKYMQALQAQQEAENKAFMDRFDTNHNGKIDGKERGPVAKYERHKQLGIE